jgi:pimeloyl-ACP methyl ester carboxylesterase
MLPENFNIAFRLQNGTRYISFFAGNNSITLSNTIKIYGSDSKSLYLKIKDKVFELNSSSENPNIYGEPDTTDHFTVEVNCHSILQDTGNPITLEDEKSLYDDYAMIMLPSTYKKVGAPVPLVIGCHGAGGDVSVQDSQTERVILYQYLVANGYAVCDCNGFPEAWCQQVGVSKLNNIGSPIAMECYIKMYQYIIQHYNVQHKVLVCGGSMGGISSTNLVLSGAIPVVAHGINCPVLDAYNQIFLHPWSGGLPKTAMGVVYGFEKDSNNNLVYDEEKLRGFNPTTNGMESYNSAGNRVTSVGAYNFTTKQLNGETVTEYKYHPCPLKIWHCENDGTVAYACSERFVRAIRNAGGNAVLRSLITGGHGPLETGDVLETPSGNVNYRGKTLSIKPVIEETFMFFERYAQK